MENVKLIAVDEKDLERASTALAAEEIETADGDEYAMNIAEIGYLHGAKGVQFDGMDNAYDTYKDIMVEFTKQEADAYLDDFVNKKLDETAVTADELEKLEDETRSEDVKTYEVEDTELASSVEAE